MFPPLLTAHDLTVTGYYISGRKKSAATVASRAGASPALEILASMHPFSQKMTPPYSRVVALAFRGVKE